MRETTGNLWDYWGRKHVVVCITTNGFVKSTGSAVMGRGCALEATRKFPGVARELGKLIRGNGNVVQFIRFGLLSFPVKHNWWEAADPKLIACSAASLNVMAREHPELTYVLPRPGCGNGRLEWSEVSVILKDLPDNVLVISK
jgi:hypothetical protein